MLINYLKPLAVILAIICIIIGVATMSLGALLWSVIVSAVLMAVGFFYTGDNTTGGLITGGLIVLILVVVLLPSIFRKPLDQFIALPWYIMAILGLIVVTILSKKLGISISPKLITGVLVLGLLFVIVVEPQKTKTRFKEKAEENPGFVIDNGDILHTKNGTTVERETGKTPKQYDNKNELHLLQASIERAWKNGEDYQESYTFTKKIKESFPCIPDLQVSISTIAVNGKFPLLSYTNKRNRELKNIEANPNYALNEFVPSTKTFSIMNQTDKTIKVIITWGCRPERNNLEKASNLLRFGSFE